MLVVEKQLPLVNDFCCSISIKQNIATASEIQAKCYLFHDLALWGFRLRKCSLIPSIWADYQDEVQFSFLFIDLSIHSADLSKEISCLSLWLLISANPDLFFAWIRVSNPPRSPWSTARAKNCSAAWPKLPILIFESGSPLLLQGRSDFCGYLGIY